MVMRPEPWGEALDEIIESCDGLPRLVVPTPAGRPFTQSMAEDLAHEPWLVFAAGRYEGVDQRVVDHYSDRLVVDEISIGDYVFNGGEVAVMVMVEAIARLLPGFVGNPESLAEESHSAGSDGLLEYPVYTKPPRWRDLDVPDVLLSGHHGLIDDWRRVQSTRRTAERRPDLLRHAALTTASSIEPVLAVPADAPELWVLQRCCWVSEAQLNDALDVPPLVEGFADVLAGIRDWRTYVARADNRLVASGRGRLVGRIWHVGRLMVAPDLQGRGLGRALLEFVEAQAPDAAESYELFTGARSDDNLRMYRRAGYRPAPAQPEDTGIVRLAKRRR
jgi:tRNA (guanine37-N1)-methyltransferase